METARKIERMDCPTCGRRLFDKEEGAYGYTREKCRFCRDTSGTRGREFCPIMQISTSQGESVN